MSCVNNAFAFVLHFFLKKYGGFGELGLFGAVLGPSPNLFLCVEGVCAQQGTAYERISGVFVWEQDLTNV